MKEAVVLFSDSNDSIYLISGSSCGSEDMFPGISSQCQVVFPQKTSGPLNHISASWQRNDVSPRDTASAGCLLDPTYPECDGSELSCIVNKRFTTGLTLRAYLFSDISLMVSLQVSKYANVCRELPLEAVQPFFNARTVGRKLHIISSPRKCNLVVSIYSAYGLPTLSKNVLSSREIAESAHESSAHSWLNNCCSCPCESRCS